MKLLTVVIFLFTAQLFAQSLYICGKVSDASTGNSLSSANVILYHLPDSTIQGTSTNSKGYFKLQSIKKGNYILTIKYLGYQTFTQELHVTNKSIDVGEIKLNPDKVQIDEVYIIDKVPVAVMSGDTLVYNADAFKVNKDAVAEDLLQKVPGIQVEDGKVKAQGEEVKKVYVDGKTFFGDDPNMALKNVPADIIEKVQIFDQQSEQSEFSGFDDGSTSKAINIITRLNISSGTFGRLKAGYGNEDRYNAGGDVHMFSDEQRLSLIGQLNNTNEQGFSSMDMLGVMSGPDGKMGMGSREMRLGGDNMSQPNMISGQGGNTNVKGIGFNYNYEWNKDDELGGSYFYNSTDNDLISQLNRDYLTVTNNDQTYIEDNTTNSQNTNHRFNLRFDYAIDSLNQIRFIPSFSLQKNRGYSDLNASTSQLNNLVNSTKSISSTDLNAINFNSMLMYRHSFNKSGRTISFGLNTNINKSDGDKKQFSESIYYNSLAQTDTIDQLTDLLSKGSTFSGNLTYTEPINSYNYLMFNASHSISKENNDKKTYGYTLLSDNYNSLDTSLSNEYDKNYTNSSAGFGYRFQKNKISINANLNYNHSVLTSEQIYPYSSQFVKSFNSILPSLILRYNISRDKNLNIFYRASNNAPSVTQLQNILDNSNPLQLSIGNPDLKQEYNHNAIIRFSTINFSNMHTFFLMLSSSYKSNYIGTNTIIAKNDTILSNGILLNAGSQISKPVNVEGYVSAQTYMTYGMPADFISSNVNINLQASYTRTPGIVNNISNYSNSYNYGFGAVISSNISSDLDFFVSSTTAYNVVKNSRARENNDEYLSQLSRLRLYWLLFDNFVFQGDLTHKFDGGLSDSYDPNTVSLNLSFGVKFFSDNRAELKLSVYDLLNQNSNISRQTTDYYLQEYSTNVIGRYFMLSFMYNLRSFS
jgi:hypothetical protein